MLFPRLFTRVHARHSKRHSWLEAKACGSRRIPGCLFFFSGRFTSICLDVSLRLVPLTLYIIIVARLRALRYVPILLQLFCIFFSVRVDSDRWRTHRAIAFDRAIRISSSQPIQSLSAVLCTYSPPKPKQWKLAITATLSLSAAPRAMRWLLRSHRRSFLCSAAPFGAKNAAQIHG